jgi:hypothetical protein
MHDLRFILHTPHGYQTTNLKHYPQNQCQKSYHRPPTSRTAAPSAAMRHWRIHRSGTGSECAGTQCAPKGLRVLFSRRAVSIGRVGNATSALSQRALLTVQRRAQRRARRRARGNERASHSYRISPTAIRPRQNPPPPLCHAIGTAAVTPQSRTSLAGRVDELRRGRRCSARRTWSCPITAPLAELWESHLHLARYACAWPCSSTY